MTPVPVLSHSGHQELRELPDPSAAVLSAGRGGHADLSDSF